MKAVKTNGFQFVFGYRPFTQLNRNPIAFPLPTHLPCSCALLAHNSVSLKERVEKGLEKAALVNAPQIGLNGRPYTTRFNSSTSTRSMLHHTNCNTRHTTGPQDTPESESYSTAKTVPEQNKSWYTIPTVPHGEPASES